MQATDAFGHVDLTPAVYAWTIDTVAPNTTFTGTPPALTNGTSVRFDFVSTEAGSTFGCSLDGAAFSTCTSPTILHGLAAGSHTFQVQATDQAGNTDPTPASFTFTIDIAAPSLTSFIVNTPALDTTNGPANVSTTLTMTDDASGVSTPTVDMTSPTGFLRSGSCVLSSGTLLNRTYQCTGTLPQYSESVVWQFSVRLRDVAGNTTTVTNAQLVTLGFTASFTNASQPGINLPTLVRVNDPALPAGVDGFNLTRDTTTGLEWLDLTLTKGLSYDDIASGAGGFLSAGFRIATTSEVATLFTHAGATNLAGDSLPAQFSAAFNLISLLGCTFACAGSASQGYMDFVPTNPSQATDGLVQTLSSSIGIFRVGMGPTFKNTRSPDVGTFLYRSTRARKIYWSEDDKLRRANVDIQPGETPTTRTDIENLLVGQPVCCGRALAIDETNRKVYLATAANNFVGIQRANVDIPAGQTASNRTDVEVLVPGQMWGIALDVASGKMYWTQTFNGNVRRSNLNIPAGQTANNRTDIEDLVVGESINRRYVALDKTAGKMYFVDGNGGRIQRANLDGSNLEHLVTGLFSYETVALVLDLQAGKFYFTRGGFGGPTKIQRANLDGSSVEDVVLLSAPPYGLAIDAVSGKLYWGTGAQDGNDKIQRANLQIPAGQTAATRTDVEDIVTGLNFVTGIALEFAPIDTIGPETTITTSPATLTNSTTATFEFTSNESAVPFACSLDGGTFAACSSPQTYTNLGEGSHSFQVRGTDQFGNTDATPASFNWTIDIIPPETTITANPPATTTSTSAAFEFTSSEAATFACSLDGAAFSNCATPQNYTGLTVGPHIFQVRAIDAAGNFDTTPASHSWTINTLDVTPPETAITLKPLALTANTTASFNFTSTETGSTFACSLDGGAFTACASPQAYNALANGSHTFQVRATDGAGNTDQTPASYIWTIDTTRTVDTSAPVLASFVIDTPTVDTSSGPATVLATAVVQDDLSGVNFLSWNVRLQGQTGDVVGGQCSLTSGTVLDGIYRCPGTLPQFSAVGTWQVVSVTARDAVNNPRIYSSTDLTSLGFPSTFINTGQQDLAAPVLASFVIDTPTVDTSSGPATVLATAVVQDDLSGVNFLSWNVRLQGQTGDVVGGQCSLTSGTVLDGIYRCPVTLPQFSAVGTWQVVSVTARDAVNNPRIYSSTDLTSLGFPSTFVNDPVTGSQLVTVLHSIYGQWRERYRGGPWRQFNSR